jgi:mono/diheme cytochrome c family protein
MRSASCIAASVVLALSGCGGGDEQPQATERTKPEAVAGDAERGRQVFLESGCGGCHTFEAAGATRNVGPNLDEVAAMYDADFIRESIVDPQAFVEKGSAGSIGGETEYGTEMPAYGPDEEPPQQLSEQELADLVAFLTAG